MGGCIMEHKITTERILEAAKTCDATGSNTKCRLRTMFPDAFKEELKFHVNKINYRGECLFTVRTDMDGDLVIDGSNMPKELIIKKDYILNTEWDVYNNLHISFKDKE